MKNTLTVLLVFFLTACQSNSSKESQIHEKLLGFKTKIFADLGDEKYNKYEKKADKGNVKIKYIHDIIYVSYYAELNACGEYQGNIDVKNDSIILELNLVSDEVCTSLRIDRITFLIDNPDEKNKIIVKK